MSPPSAGGGNGASGKPGEPDGRPRRGHRPAAVLGGAVLLLSIAPLYPYFAGIRPFVLGMPFSMFWLCLMIAVVFLSFSALFLADREQDEALDREYRAEGEGGPPA